MLWTFGEGRSSAGVKGTDLHGKGLLNLPRSSYLQFVSFILGRANASPSNTQGGSPVRESRPPGSVRGAFSNGCPYRDRASEDIRLKRKLSRNRPQLVLRGNWRPETTLLCVGVSILNKMIPL